MKNQYSSTEKIISILKQIFARCKGTINYYSKMQVSNQTLNEVLTL